MAGSFQCRVGQFYPTAFTAELLLAAVAVAPLLPATAAAVVSSWNLKAAIEQLYSNGSSGGEIDKRGKKIRKWGRGKLKMEGNDECEKCIF